MIEDGTGYYSGSYYNEHDLHFGGFVGEFEPPTSGRTIVVKNHGHDEMENADGIIFVVRSGYVKPKFEGTPIGLKFWEYT